MCLCGVLGAEAGVLTPEVVEEIRSFFRRCIDDLTQRIGGPEAEARACRDGVVPRLIRPRRNSSQKSVCITSNDSSGQCSLGGKMVMHACAFDTELSRKLAKAEAPISGITDMALSQIH